MYKSLGAILIVWCFTLQMRGQDPYELSIPAQVSPIKTNSHEIYPTTQLWIKIPRGFRLQSPFPGYKKGDDNLLRITDGWISGYTYLKTDYIGRYEDAISKNVRPKYMYRKEFKLGDQNAFIDYYKLSIKENLEFLKMIIGNDSRATMIDCEFSAGDTVTRKDLVKSLMSISLDETINASPGELIDYIFETSNSKLRFSHSIGGAAFLYSFIVPEGKINNNSESYVNLSPFSYAMDTMAMRVEAMKGVEDIKLMDHGEISRISGKHIYINNLDGYELSFESRTKDETFTCFNIIVGDKKNSISLFAKMPTKNKEFEHEVRRIFYTIKKRDR